MNNKKVSIYEDDLKRVYELADNIKGLALHKKENPYFLLGLAAGHADTIRVILETTTHDRIAGKEEDK